MKQKSKLATALKLGVIALCLFLVSRKLDWHEVRAALVVAHPLYFLPAQIMILLEPVIMAQKWNLLLKRKQVQAGFLNLARLVFTSNFLSIFLATAVGADAARVFLMSRRKHNLTHATASLVADRLLGLGAIAVLSLAGIAIAHGRLPAGVNIALVLVPCLAALAGIVLLMSPLPTHVVRALERLLPAAATAGPVSRLARRGTALLTRLHDSLREYLAMPRVLAAVFALNVLVQVLRTLQIHCLFRALGVPVVLEQELVFVPIIILLSLLPLSYFGMGIKEGAFVYFFSALGVPAAQAVSVSILTYPLIVVGLLPGGLFLLLPERALPEAPALPDTPAAPAPTPGRPPT